MVNEKLIIPKENIYKTEEVRYLENQETLTNKFLKSIFPNAYCMDDNDGISVRTSFGAKLKADSNNIGTEVKVGVDIIIETDH